MNCPALFVLQVILCLPGWATPTLAQSWQRVWGKGNHIDVTGLILNDEQDTCISAGSDSTVKCWYIPEKRLLWSADMGFQVSCLALARSAGKIVVGLNWDPADSTRVRYLSLRGEPTGEHSGPSNGVRSIDVTADGTLTVAVGYDGSIWSWRGNDVHQKLDAKASCIALADSGRIAITGHTDGAVVLWSTSTWSAIDTLLLGGEVLSVVVSAGVKWALVGSTGPPQAPFGNVTRVSIDGPMAIDYSTNTYEWDLTDGAILSLSVLTGGEIAVAGTESGNVVRFFAANGRKEIAKYGQVQGITALAAGSSTVVSGSSGGTIAIWTSAYAAPLYLLEMPMPAWDLSYGTLELQLATIGWLGAIEFDGTTGRYRRWYNANDWTSTIAYAPGGTEICAGTSGGLTFLSTESGSIVASASVAGAVGRVRYSRDGRHLWYRSEGACGVIDRASLDFREIETYSDPENVSAVGAFDVSGSRFLVGRESGTLTSYGIDGTQLASRQVHSGVCSGVEAAPDGSGWYSIGWDSTLRFSSLDLSESRILYVADCPLDAVTMIDSALVAIGTSNGSVVAIDPSSGRATELAHLNKSILSMAVNSTSEWLAIGTSDELAVGRLQLTSAAPGSIPGSAPISYRIAGDRLRITVADDDPVIVVLADPLGRILCRRAYMHPRQHEIDLSLDADGLVYVVLTSRARTTVLPLIVRR